MRKNDSDILSYEQIVSVAKEAAKLSEHAGRRTVMKQDIKMAAKLVLNK